MSLLRISFAAPINKVEFKEVGGKSLAEVSICRKNRVKEGDPEAWTWLRLSIWSAPDWMQRKMVKGAMIAGSGEFTLRSYEKDGVKRQSAECNCQSFDVEIAGDDREQAPAPVAKPHARPVHRTAAPSPPDDIPFHPDHALHLI